MISFVTIGRYLVTKRVLFLLTCFLFAVVFHNFFKIKFDDWLVKPGVLRVNSSWLNDMAILVLLVVVVFALLYYYQDRILLHPDWIILFLFVLTAYTYCRQNVFYDLVTFYWVPKVFYLDTLYVLFFILSVAKIYAEWRSHEPPVYLNTPFLVDLPIKNAGGDLLNRKKFAKKIANKIQSKLPPTDAGALAIGVTGEWGAGKTSFQNMIFEALDKKNRIIVHFNPWRSSNSQKIIEDFFELLIQELKKYDSTLSSNIYSYAKTLTKIDKNMLTKTLEALGDVFNDSTKNEVYNEINSSISAINKQLIIFIDDLDRLDKKEIVEVLRLIRNTANFNNVVYLVAYDKGYVLEAVKLFNSHNYQAFLEKIFQFEFSLPMYEPGIIRKYLKGLLIAGLPEILHSQTSSIIDSDLHKGINFTNEVIKTHREAIRLANSILFEIDGIEDDVFLYDFYLLQLIKLQFPFVYRSLIDFKDLFFIHDSKDNDKYLRLRLTHERTLDTNTMALIRAFSLSSQGNINLDEDQKKPLFDRFLYQNKEKLAVDEQDILLIKEIVDELLDGGRKFNERYKNEFYKAFYRSANFLKYFAFELEEGEIPSKEFEEARREDFDAYTAKVNKWIADGKWEAFLDRILKISDFADLREFENHVRALCEVGKVFVKTNNPYIFNYKHLIKILSFPQEGMNGSNLKLYDNSEQFQDFLRSLFASDGLDKRFEGRLLQMIIDFEADFPLPFEELSSLALNYLQDYVAANEPIQDTFWVLLRSARVRTADGYRGEPNPLAQELGKGYYLSHVDTCSLGEFIHQINPDSEYYSIKFDTLKDYFDTVAEFKIWFESAEQLDRASECYSELVNFYQSQEVNEFKPIKYDFQRLKPIRWR